MSDKGTTRTRTGMAVMSVFVVLLASACGGNTASDANAPKPEDLAATGLSAEAGESGLDEAGEPVRGGTLVYGIEAETDNFCFPEGQLAISGMTVARSMYDTLVSVNAEGDAVGYLASDIAHNDDYTEWTFTIRDGIEFHDGSPLNAQVVKNNIDAYRGTYEGRSSLLLGFTMRAVSGTAVTDPMTLKVTTNVPWIAFPNYLAGPRISIMAQAQLDDADHCDTNLIGTGPFMLASWNPGENLVVERNPQYWQEAPDGEPYPYLDGIEFRAIPDGQVRANSIESNNVDVIHSSGADRIGNTYKDLRDEGKVNLYVSEVAAELDFLQLNHTAPPFDDPRMRKALAMSIDREKLDDFIGDGMYTIASGPFAPDSPAYLEDAGYPEPDLEGAKALVAEYEAEGNKAEFTITSVGEPTVRRISELTQQQAIKAGFKVNISERDQTALISDAIGKKYDAMYFRNYAGGDPDNTYVWWYGGTTGEDGNFVPNTVNFGGWNDEEVNRLLDAGRSELDPDARIEIYQDLNRRMASEVHGIWNWYSPWAIVVASDVHGVLGPLLPDRSPPNQALNSGHPLLGMWMEKR